MQGRDPAIVKFILLNVIRIAGLFSVLAGIAGLGDRLSMPDWLAAAAVVLGVGLFFIVPMFVARRWKGRK